MKKYLFIGGPLDGIRRECELPTYPSPVLRYSEDLTTFVETKYVRQQRNINGELETVYVHTIGDTK